MSSVIKSVSSQDTFIPRRMNRRFIYVVDNATTTDEIGEVLANDISGGTATWAGPSADDGAGATLLSGAVLNNHFFVNTQLNYRAGRLVEAYIRLRFLTAADAANARLWFGFTDQLGSVMAAADDPAGNYAAFRSTGGVDTNWRCCVKDAVTQNPQDSGVVVGIVKTILGVREVSAGIWQFLIDGVIRQTLSVNAPAPGTNLRITYGIRNIVGAPTRQVHVGRLYIASDD